MWSSLFIGVISGIIITIIFDDDINWKNFTEYILKAIDQKYPNVHNRIVNTLKFLTISYNIITKNIRYYLGAFIIITPFLFSFILFYFVKNNVTNVNFFGLNNLKNYRLFLDLLGFKVQNDFILTFFFSFIIKTLTLILPLSITFYIFTYREQKVLSHSSIKQSSPTSLLIIFIILSSFTLVYTGHCSSLLKIHLKTLKDFNNIGLDFTEKHLGAINLLFYLFSLSLITGVITIISLWRRLNLKTTLKKNIKDIKKDIFYLSFVKDNFAKNNNIFILNNILISQRKKLYSNLHYKVESVYQLLIQSIDNNMNELYENNYKDWEDVLSYIHSHNRIYYLCPEERYLYFLRTHPRDYLDLYKAILKNHTYLITKLYEKNHIEYGNKAIKKLFSMGPTTFKVYKKLPDKKIDQIKSSYNELLSTYFSILLELSISLYQNKIVGINPILNNINQMLKQDKMVKAIDIITIYRSLIVRAIEENDLKFLTILINSLLMIVLNTKPTYYIESYDNHTPSSTNELFGKNLNLTNTNRRIEEINNRNSKQDTKTDLNLKISVFTFFEAILKSIELGHYQCTGFILKSLVSNIEDDIINDEFLHFVRHKGLINPYIVENRLYKEFQIEFNISTLSVDYCLAKMTILLYGQQKYYKNILNKDLPISFYSIKAVDIKSGISKSQNIEYLFKKLEKANDKYGLLYLSDDEFMKKIKKAIQLELQQNSYNKRNAFSK
ncbi:hypothetical protein [Parageobacillus sp. KH3-4]|uniref:hypothetical protein n=1 Tax=Parageobacillus sp. KH3-4 TaxID=2916802 RepID=UPI001FCA9FF2|nr:hypothetical protein [Parageobacillus sp. KH3-4]BDG46394.1 hypothetical protein PspKH34_09550 [Parageobacillus sp. KH3-4]